MKIIIKAILPVFLIVVTVTSCNSSPSSVQTNPTKVIATAVSLVLTIAVETQAAVPTTTPIMYLPTTIVGPYDVMPPNPDQQVYIDPDGWYAVNFPADMKPTDKPNSFRNGDNHLETGYLPDMGYMQNTIDVCTWLANLELKPEQSTVGEGWSFGEDWTSCIASTKMDFGYLINYTIHENPAADIEHRFIYIKTASGYPGSNFTFSWLKPISNITPETNLTPINSEEISFWNNTISMPSNISVTEYALPPEKNPTQNDGLFQFIPTQAWPVWKANTSPTPHKTTLAELGYEINNSQLYRDGRLLFKNVSHVSDIYTVSTDSGPVTAFIVEIELGRENYLIQNDVVQAWGGYAIYNSAPILYQGELLWARTAPGHVEIKKSNGDVIFTFAVNLPPNHYPRFRAWDGHWILDVENFVIQDGEILNKNLGFEEMFNWGLVKGKPTYFFRKGSKVGISHDGQILPLQYQDIAHGLCCGPAQNNPGIGDDFMHFYGKRNDAWYYVVLEFR
jgi:hypothetical protein